MNRTHLTRTALLATLATSAAIAAVPNTDISMSVDGDVTAITFDVPDGRYPIVENGRGERLADPTFTSSDGRVLRGRGAELPFLGEGRYRMNLAGSSTAADGGVTLILRSPPSTDITGDGRVNGDDLAEVLANWGSDDCALGADIVADCNVDIHDLIRVLDGWSNGGS